MPIALDNRDIKSGRCEDAGGHRLLKLKDLQADLGYHAKNGLVSPQHSRMPANLFSSEDPRKPSIMTQRNPIVPQNFNAK